MPDNLDTKKTHSHPWQTQKLNYTLTNFCESLGKEKTLEQIDAAFETWQSVCGLKFTRVESEDCEIKVSFLNDQINWAKRGHISTRILSWGRFYLRRHSF